MAIKLFVSHAASDTLLAKAVTILFQRALRLQNSEIRCTSVTPYNLNAGANTDATLRKELNQAKLVIGILTKDSAESYYVLTELGARWALDKHFMIFRSSNFTFPGFGGPLANLMISPIDSKEIWRKHLDQAVKYFRRDRVNDTAAIRRLINKVIKENDALSTGLLLIHSALWGTDTAKMDITARVANLVKNDALSVFVGNDLAAHDPAPSSAKEIEIDFTYNGRRKKQKWTEGTHLMIPDKI